jgi:hypothetical protein
LKNKSFILWNSWGGGLWDVWWWFMGWRKRDLRIVVKNSCISTTIKLCSSPVVFYEKGSSMQKPRQEKAARLEVIKHSAAIQIQNNITLLQRRAWNVLLRNAYDRLPSEEIHRIAIAELCRILGYASHNQEYLKDALRTMTTCSVEWNVLGKDGAEEWGVAALLADARIRDGICSYSYGAQFRQVLHNPRLYARLDLSLQNQFDSKYALALWELCTDYLGAVREHGETPSIPLEQFRKLMGLTGAYALFRELNKYVIKPAVTEINRVSDLKVTVDYQRKGRKVVALKFKICRMLMLPESLQPDLLPDLDDMPAVVKLLTDAGLTIHDALEIWQKGFDMVEPGKRPPAGNNPKEAFAQYVKEKIHLLRQRRASGKLTNPAGFLLSAIQKNYGNTRMEQETSGRARKEQAQELERLQQQQQQVTRKMEDTLHALADQIIETLPELLDEGIAALQAENNALVDWYDVRRTPLHNYRKHPAVAIGVGQWLEKRFPEHFAKAREPFAAKLASIEARLVELDGRMAVVR